MVDVKSLYPPAEAQVDTAALAMIIRSGIGAVVLDARAGEYDDGSRIPTAKALAANCTAEQAARVIGSRDALIVTYCTNLHCPASTMLYKRLKELGYENVLEYHDGIEGWMAARYPVEEAAKAA